MILRARSILGLSSGRLAGALGRLVAFAEGAAAARGLRRRRRRIAARARAARSPGHDTVDLGVGGYYDEKVICGPRGVGKSAARLQAEEDEFAIASVDATTRAPRPSEAAMPTDPPARPRRRRTNGRDVRASRAAPIPQVATRLSHVHHQARRRIHRAARVHANIYGTSAAAVRAVAAAGKCCLLDIDVQVLHEVSIHTARFYTPRNSPSSTGRRARQEVRRTRRFVFVAPPSYDELEKRLRGRGDRRGRTREAAHGAWYRELPRAAREMAYGMEVT